MAQVPRLALVAAAGLALCVLAILLRSPERSLTPRVSAPVGLAADAESPRRVLAADSRTPTPARSASVVSSSDARWTAEETAVQRAAEGRASLEVRFHPAGASDVGVAGVPCRLQTATGETRSAVSDTEGRASFGDLAAGLVAFDTAFEDTRSYRLAPGQHARTDVAVPAPLELGGRVVGPRGEPIAGAEVVCTLRGDFAAELVVATTDPDGRFELADFRGRGYLLARAPGFARSPAALVDETVGELVLRLQVARAYRGLVLDARGAPVPGARVSVGSGAQLLGPDTDGRPGERFPTLWSGVTDREGRFAIADVLVDDDLGVTVAKPGFATTVVARVADPEVLEVRLADELPVRGRVTDSAGEPLAEVLVQWGDPTTLLSASVRSDEAGRFVLAGVAPEPVVRLRAQREGYRARVVELPAAAFEAGVELTLLR